MKVWVSGPQKRLFEMWDLWHVDLEKVYFNEDSSEWMTKFGTRILSIYC
jgi:hypothetical protein